MVVMRVVRMVAWRVGMMVELMVVTMAALTAAL